MSNRRKPSREFSSYNYVNNEVPGEVAGDGFVEISPGGTFTNTELVHAHQAGKLRSSKIEEIIIKTVHSSEKFKGIQRLMIIDFLKELLITQTGELKSKWQTMLREGKILKLRYFSQNLNAYIKKSETKSVVSFMGENVKEIKTITDSCLKELSRKQGVGKKTKNTKKKGRKSMNTKRKSSSNRKTKRPNKN